MKLKIKQTKVSVEKRMLHAMILSTDFLKNYAYIHKHGYFITSYGEWVAETCLSHYKDYKEAPGKTILELYAQAIKLRTINPTIQDITLKFLKSVPYDGFANVNVEYLLKRSKDHIILRVHKLLKDRLEIALDKEDPVLCEKAISDVKKIELSSGNVCNPFTDKEKIMNAFLKDEKPLFKLTGALGRMINPQLKTKKMIAFLGRAKSGKTWWLYLFAIIAKRWGNNVAVFAAGDEDEDSSIVRWGCMLTGKNSEEEYTGKFAMPVMDCRKNQTGECSRSCRKCACMLPDIPDEEYAKMKPEDLLRNTPKGYKVCTVCRGKKTNVYVPAIWYEWKKVDHLIWQQAYRSFRRFTKYTPKASVKLFSYPSDTLTVSEIDRVLTREEDNNGWVPTVVIVDYPDIMTDESGNKEVRHKENSKWIGLRRLNQEKSVLLIVATQSNMMGYGSDSLGAQNVNEDRRKLDHVTALFGINKTDDEERKRICRIGPIMFRKGRADVAYQVLVLQGLEMGVPARDSEFVFKSVTPVEKRK